VIDLEFNQSFDFPTGLKIKKNAKCPFEIIQIGAIKLDDNLTELDRKSFLVKPQIYERMHPFVEKITGISMADLKKESFFDEVYQAFIEFIGPEKSTFCVWGSNDMHVLYRNLVFYKLNHRLLSRHYINVQDLASVFLKQSAHSCVGLKAAVEAFHIAEDKNFHDALNDAIYTAEIFKIVKNPQIRAESFNLSQLKQEKKPGMSTPVNVIRLNKYAEKQLQRKLTDREKEAVLAIYIAGRQNEFDPKFDCKIDTRPV
jgi:DNA polymerase III epsilon subunit-like protein